jgi:hypothetical protein
MANGNVENYEGKNGRGPRRSIPASPRILEMLERRFATADSEWIFAAPTKSGHIDRSSITKPHAAAVKTSKVGNFCDLLALPHVPNALGGVRNEPLRIDEKGRARQIDHDHAVHSPGGSQTEGIDRSGTGRFSVGTNLGQGQFYAPEGRSQYWH